MAESNNTTDAGTPGSGESAQTGNSAPETNVNDVIVTNVGDNDARVARADEGESADNAAVPLAAAPASGIEGAMLHLADLLQGEHDGNLDALLTFTSDGTDTTLHVGSTQVGQDFVLQGVGDLTAGGARSASAIIADLLTQGTLTPDA